MTCYSYPSIPSRSPLTCCVTFSMKKKKKDFCSFSFFLFWTINVIAFGAYIIVMCLWVCISLTWRWMTSSETFSPLMVGSIAPRIISMRLRPVAAENCLAWSEGNSLPYLNKHTQTFTLIKLQQETNKSLKFNGSTILTSVFPKLH